MTEVLDKNEYLRYGRQLIIPEIGKSGQEKLKSSRVLVIGAGGLGCPSVQYLAAAGVGCIGIVDNDKVEISNLHRQVMHSEDRVNIPKVESMNRSVMSLNSSVKCEIFIVRLNADNALPIVTQFDIVLDCTDNVATRYLINDACVLADKPLVSGSALRWEGQLSVYHCKSNGVMGPCMRCIHPTPPPAATVTNCSDGGIMGFVCGMIGSMQASECVKIIVGLGSSFAGRLLALNALDGRMMNVALRSKRLDCIVCGENPSLTKLVDMPTNDCSVLNEMARLPKDRITTEKYSELALSSRPHILLDVRPSVEFDIVQLPSPKRGCQLNIPFKDIQNSGLQSDILEKITQHSQKFDAKHIVMVCRRGNDSQRAATILSNHLSSEFVLTDLIGGITEWAKKVDPHMPIY